MNKVMTRIVAAVVDTEFLTLYREDGSTISIPQGDARVRRIITEATPSLISHGYADVDISIIEENSYASFEEKTNGLVKFFRVAKNKLKSLMGTDTEPMEEMSIGQIPKSKADRMLSAANSIMENAVSVSSPEFHEKGLNTQAPITVNGHTPGQHVEETSDDTMVAVVGNKVIPGVEKIRNQFTNANKLGNTIGVENFLKRISKVIDKRSHSIEDLLKFMERGDLPIADDGCILVYKVLKRENNKIVDCHTKRVAQHVGAYVCMDESLVDHNRNNECSNGLHIARRGYVSFFSGDLCVLAKLAPEDVIAVPSYDANKMRVCGYHIIAELTKEQYDLINRNKPITDDPAGAVLLANALKGNHIGKTHEVRITQQKGHGVELKSLTTTNEKKPRLDKTLEPVQALHDTHELSDTAVDPVQVVKDVEQVRQVTRKEQAMQMSAAYRETPTQEGYDALLALKKTSKVSWEKLGIPEPASLVQAVVTQKASKPKAPTKAAVKSKSKKKPTPKPKAKKAVAAPTSRVVNGVELGLGTYKERIQKLLPCTSVGSADAILNLKKQAKKSWEALGVPNADVETIQIYATKGK